MFLGGRGFYVNVMIVKWGGYGREGVGVAGPVHVVPGPLAEPVLGDAEGRVGLLFGFVVVSVLHLKFHFLVRFILYSIQTLIG